ncbi:MAG: (Fe-S)-binding protein, partial [Deltaproteobacteria bacterium]|nr:(Fe-S)-binding protein [Deltaproteobacteria bacterium]
MRITLFIPCLIDQFHPQVGKNVVHILKKVGVEVDFAKEHTCCGQPFFNAGYWKRAIPLAKRTIKAFKGAHVVVAPSGSCVHMIRKHYLELFRDTPIWLDQAQELSEKTYEFSEFLIKVIQVDDLGACFKGRVTYHDSCQVLHGLGLSSEPRQLIKKVRNLEFVEMERPHLCCGFGGFFSFKFPHIAEAMVEEKVKNILATGAEAVVGCEISCLMNIGGYLKHRGIPVRA